MALTLLSYRRKALRSYQICSLKAFGGFFGDLKFPIIFSLLFLFSFTIAFFLPSSIDNALMHLTSTGAVSFAKVIGLSSASETGMVIAIEGKRLSIVSECTAIGYILIFISAVIAYPATVKNKITGLIFCIPAIVFLNLVRIVFLGWVGGNHPAYFDLFHTYLWEGGFLLLIVLVWMVWVNISMGNLEFGMRNERKCAVDSIAAFWKRGMVRVLLAGAFIMALLLSPSDEYQRLLASVSDSLVHAAGVDGGVILSNGKKLMVIMSINQYREVWVGAYYLLPFIVLTLLFPGRKMMHNIPAVDTSIKIAGGLFAIMFIHLFTVVVFFMVTRYGGESWHMMVADIFARVSPVIVWMFLSASSFLFQANLKLKT